MMDFFSGLVTGLGHAVLAFLPVSPFIGILSRFDDIAGVYLSYFNWFFPVSEFLEIGYLWLASIISYYAMSALLKWVKLI